MTLEQIFNQVKAHLLKQNEKSLKIYGCAYRGYNGLMCAVGCLIKDEHYSENMETASFLDVELRFTEAFEHLNLDADKHAMLIDLQTVHDKYDPTFWKERLDVIYNNYVAKKK